MPAHPEIRPEQSIELLKALHILTREGKMNQDSRRKLKQVYHLYQLIAPLLLAPLLQNLLQRGRDDFWLVDHGAGKSYLGFILYDLFLKSKAQGTICGIETRAELTHKSADLAQQLGFTRMLFEHASIAQAAESSRIPAQVEMVTALHACNTATDEAIDFGLRKQATFMVLVPCCQAEVASALASNRQALIASGAMSALMRHPLHAREFGSHLTNVLRVLRLEAADYDVTVTELVGWEHSLKNELIIAKKRPQPLPKKSQQSREALVALMQQFKLTELAGRFGSMQN